MLPIMDRGLAKPFCNEFGKVLGKPALWKPFVKGLGNVDESWLESGLWAIGGGGAFWAAPHDWKYM